MRILLWLLLASFSSIIYGQNGVGIGTLTPDASSILDLNSTDQGLLIPRMTTLQREGIGSPADGLMVYDTDEKSLWFYTSTGGWKIVTSGIQPWFSNPDGIFYVPNNVAIGSPSNKMDHFLVDSRANPPTTTHTMKLISNPNQIGLEILNPGGFALNSTGAAFFNGNVGIGTLPSPLNSAYIKATGPNTAAALLVEHDGSNSNALEAINNDPSGYAAYFQGNTQVSFGNFQADDLSFFGGIPFTNATVNITNAIGQDNGLYVGTSSPDGTALIVNASGIGSKAATVIGRSEFRDGELLVNRSNLRLKETAIEMQGVDLLKSATIEYEEADDRIKVVADAFNVSSLSGTGTRNVVVNAEGDLIASEASSTEEYDTSYYMVHYADFEVYEDAGDELDIFNCTVRSNGDAGNAGKIIAPLHLPHESEIIQITTHGNKKTTGTLSFYLQEMNVASSFTSCSSTVNIASLIIQPSSTYSIPFNIMFNTITTPLPIDNSENAYAILVDSDEWGADINIRAIRITFRTQNN